MLISSVSVLQVRQVPSIMVGVVRQLLEQNTDVVMVGWVIPTKVCMRGYYKGTYIAYSKGEAHLHESVQGHEGGIWT